MASTIGNTAFPNNPMHPFVFQNLTDVVLAATCSAGVQEVHTPRQGRPSVDPGRRFSQLQRQQSTASQISLRNQRSLRPQQSVSRSLSSRIGGTSPSAQQPIQVRLCVSSFYSAYQFCAHSGECTQCGLTLKRA